MPTSRLPLPEEPAEVPLPGETILLMENLQALPVTSAQLAMWTDRDDVRTKSPGPTPLHPWE